MAKNSKSVCSNILYIIAFLAVATSLGFYIAVAAGANPVLLDIGIWMTLGAVVVAIVARALTGKKMVD